MSLAPETVPLITGPALDGLTRPPETLQLSQGHLNLLSICPRKFQHLYLEQLGLPPQDPQQQERQELGSRFHQLMQQWELGLPVETFLQLDPLLNRWFAAFQSCPPPMIDRHGSAQDSYSRQSEHRRTLLFEDCLLVAIYDLLIETPAQAQILDWKTYARPQHPSWLRQNWQTRLYPFILAETSDYAPEQLQFTYWFAEGKADGQGNQVSFTYNAAWHEEIRSELSQSLRQLRGWLDRWRQGEPFPQVAMTAGHCLGAQGTCSFAFRCGRGAPEQEDFSSLAESGSCPIAATSAHQESNLNIALIPELPIPEISLSQPPS